jgi:hypothetical protein
MLRRRSALLTAGFQELSERQKMVPWNLVLKKHGKVDSALSDTTARINCNLEPGYSVWYHDKNLVGKVCEGFICGNFI